MHFSVCFHPTHIQCSNSTQLSTYIKIWKETLQCSCNYGLWGFPAGSVVKNLSAKAGDTETWVWPLSQEDLREDEMATHSSIHAWRIPWAEKPSGQQSVGSQRVGHGWVSERTRAVDCKLCVTRMPWLCALLGGTLPGTQRSPSYSICVTD